MPQSTQQKSNHNKKAPKVIKTRRVWSPWSQIFGQSSFGALIDSLNLFRRLLKCLPTNRKKIFCLGQSRPSNFVCCMISKNPKLHCFPKKLFLSTLELFCFIISMRFKFFAETSSLAPISRFQVFFVLCCVSPIIFDVLIAIKLKKN